MTDLSQIYYSYKRSALLFGSLTLLFCVPGTEVENFTLAGVELSGLGFSVLIFLGFVAATYYSVLFFVTWWIESKSNLVAQEENGSSLEKVLTQALDRHLAATQGLQPILKSAAMRFDKENAKAELDEVRKIIAEGRIEVRLSEVSMPAFSGGERVSPSLFNLVSNQMSDVERRIPATRQLGLHDLKQKIIEASRDDFPRLVTTAVVDTMRLIWQERQKRLEKAIDSLDKFTAKFQHDVSRHQSGIESYKDGISSALFELRILKSVRTFRFVFLELAAVALVYGLMFAHYMGQFISIWPSPFVFLQ